MSLRNDPNRCPFNHCFVGLCLALLCAEAISGRATTLTVISTADSGAGTLRAALANAGNGDTINFSVAMPAMITLSNELVVSQNVSIAGPGPASVTLTGGSRAFHITNGATVFISGLTVSGEYLAGQSPFAGPEPAGAGIFNDGSTLIVSNCVISGNSAPYGGGIASSGPLTVTASTIAGNSANENSLCNSGGAGGGIYSSADLKVIASTITGNSANNNTGCQNGAGGAGIYCTAGLTVTGSTITGNSESGNNMYGAGIYNGGTGVVSNCVISGNSGSSVGGSLGGGVYSTASLTVIASTIRGNSANSGGGIWGSASLTVTATTITSNSVNIAGGVYPADKGGGIYNGGTGAVSNCNINVNTGGTGGGIYNAGVLTVSGSTISSNSGNGILPDGSGPPGTGGGIYNAAQLTVISTTIKGNFGNSGGGISSAAPLTLTSSTIQGNSAANSGGGILNSSTANISISTISGNSVPQGQAANTGGGIWNQGGTVNIATSTFYGNIAGTGGGIANNAALTVNACTFNENLATYGGSSIYNTGGPARIADTILNTDPTYDNITGGMISAGYNLSSDGGGGSLTNATDRINMDPMLGPLQDNGGPTFTCALLGGSPAIDQGRRDRFSALALNTDQRGFPRPVVFASIPKPPGGDGSDIGAFELQAAVANNPVLLTKPKKLSNGAFEFSFDTATGANYAVEYSTDLARWLPLVTLGGTGGLVNLIDPNAGSPQRFYRVVLSAQ